MTQRGIMKKEYTLLYVEDNQANMKLVEQLLASRSNITMVGAEDAEKGLELATSTVPDIILMDINLPGMDGYEALAWLRAHEATSDIPVMALSASAMTRDVEKGLAAGFVCYLTKPIDIRLFYQALDEVLESCS